MTAGPRVVSGSTESIAVEGEIGLGETSRLPFREGRGGGLSITALMSGPADLRGGKRGGEAGSGSGILARKGDFA